MCGSMCPPALAKLLGWHRAKGGQRGQRPESFLTAYEMEQLPVMLNELEKANRHFWQMVCWRWSQNEQKAAAERSAKKARHQQQMQQQQQQQETTSGEPSPKDKRKGCPDDSYVNGCALRELVRLMAKTMCEKGTFDARTETMLTEFRARILGQRNASMRETMGKESKAERRRKEFMKMRTISFNGGLGEGIGRHGKEQQQQEKGKSSASTCASSSSASSGYSSGEMPPKDRKAKTSNWLRQRANSVRDRRAGRCVCCVDNDRLARLGELLNTEFHSVVFAHPIEFDVHERELKLLVWRRFTQMLVTMWADRERNEQQQREEKQ